MILYEKIMNYHPKPQNTFKTIRKSTFMGFQDSIKMCYNLTQHYENLLTKLKCSDTTKSPKP